MPHQLALEEGLGHGGAVDRHERFVGPGAFVVNRLGDQLLAGAALPLDQDGAGIAAGDLFHHGQHVFHMPAAADDVGDPVFARLFGTQMGDLAFKLSGFEGLLDDDGELVEVEGLVDVVVGAHPHRLYRRLQHAEGGNHDDDDVNFQVLDPFQNLQAVDSRQLDIEQHQVGRLLPQNLESVFSGACRENLVALLFKVLLQRPANQMFVIHNQNFMMAHCHPLSVPWTARRPRAARW